MKQKPISTLQEILKKRKIAMENNKDIYILGVSESHNATACLLKNGEVLGCISEERLVRKKNVYGFPQKAIDCLLKDNNVSSSDIAEVSLSFVNPILLFQDVEYVVNSKSKAAYVFPVVRKLLDELMYYIPPTHKLYQFLYSNIYKRLFWPGMRKKQEALISERLGIDKARITRTDHHFCHALSSYYSFRHNDDEQGLLLTLDGGGDETCGTVMTAKGDDLELIAETLNGNSPAMFYAFITDYMGMRMGEHEYKIMGMSPYSSEYEVNKVYGIIKDLISLGDDLSFKARFSDTLFGEYFKKKLYRSRFDGIAGAAQKYVEDLLIEYVQKSTKKTGAKKLYCSGGIFMNVKANKMVLDQPDVEAAYFMPSAGDESTAIGAAFYGYMNYCKNTLGETRKPQPLENLYLGNSYDSDTVRRYIDDNRIAEKFNVYQEPDIEKKVAELLSRHYIVARLRGRMEFGARALGNRSILANPTNYDAVKVLNDKIKNRDFWMPFAGTVIAERFSDYLQPSKETDGSAMMVAFDTTELARKELIAAVHPYDFTMRAQVLHKDFNPLYHKLIWEFQRLTGVGGILNTSFNLHGEPMVCSPADAVHTLEDSGLEILAIEDFIISKIPL